MNNKEKFLPIGTVCMLKDGKKRVMITGFCTIPENDKSKVYDYNGCLYPEGVLTTSQTIVFNHDQIDKIYYMGYVDEEEKSFQEKLNKIVDDFKNGKLNIDDNKQ